MKDIPELGVGMLIHNSKRYTDYLPLVQNHVDVFELILGQYSDDPELITTLKKQLNKPFLAHNSFFSFATDSPTDEKLMHKLKGMLDRADAEWVSDHFCFTGVPGTQVGALLPPILDKEQLNVFIRRIKEAQQIIDRPIVLENVVLHYQIGDMTYSDMINRIVDACDIGILISVENITQSQFYIEMNHYQFIDALPLEKVVQVHCTIGNTAEFKQMKSQFFDPLYGKQQLHYQVLEYMAQTKRLKPKALIWELETEADSLPESSELIERLEWSKHLFGYKAQEVVTK